VPPLFTLFPYTTLFRSFYRNVVHMSAYEYIGRRFGLGGRMYASIGFLADRTFDIGVILLTTALLINGMTGWDLTWTIWGTTLLRSEEHTSELQSPYDLV